MINIRSQTHTKLSRIKNNIGLPTFVSADIRCILITMDLVIYTSHIDIDNVKQEVYINYSTNKTMKNIQV